MGTDMKPTLAPHSYLGATIAAAASRLPPVILAAILLGITAFPTRADCNPSDRIDAAAALAANVPLWLPAGTYVLDRELVIDYAPLAATGFQIISDGAIIDATATGQRAITIECSGGTPDNSKGCFYFHIQGTLFVNANTAAAAVRFGLNDFSDAHNSAKIPPDCQQRRTGARSQAELHSKCRHLCRGSNGRVGRARDGPGAVLEDLRCRVGDDRDRNADPEWLHILEYDLGDRPRGGPDLPGDHHTVGQSQHFCFAYFVCPTAIAASSGSSNLMFNPLYGSGTRPPLPGSQTGILTLP